MTRYLKLNTHQNVMLWPHHKYYAENNLALRCDVMKENQSLIISEYQFDPISYNQLIFFEVFPFPFLVQPKVNLRINHKSFELPITVFKVQFSPFSSSPSTKASVQFRTLGLGVSFYWPTHALFFTFCPSLMMIIITSRAVARYLGSGHRKLECFN